MLAKPRRGKAGSSGDTVCYAMEPRAQRVLHPQRPGLLDQDEEGSLEGILGIVRIGKDVSADAQHHRSMPFDKRSERQFGCFAAASPEPLQELTVR
jgi:hypothetical protein